MPCDIMSKCFSGEWNNLDEADRGKFRKFHAEKSMFSSWKIELTQMWTWKLRKLAWFSLHTSTGCES